MRILTAGIPKLKQETRTSPARVIDPDCELEFVAARVRTPDRPSRRLSGLSIEHVRLPDERFEYKVLGNSHYLALHDIELQDGEIELADGTRSRPRGPDVAPNFWPAGSAPN